MVIAFIPVRGGSKSIPLKNIKDFCGKPLVYWSALALQNCSLVDKIIIATDSSKIEETVRSFKLNKLTVFRRSAENACDTASTESVMLEYINKVSLNLKDIFLLVQATSPLTQSVHFEEALSLYNEGQYDSILSCVRNYRFFWNADGTSKNYDYKKRPRRQNIKGELMENGAFYINTVENILSSNNRLSGRIGIYEMPEYTATELDEPDDWIILENLMRKYILCENPSQLWFLWMLFDVFIVAWFMWKLFSRQDSIGFIVALIFYGVGVIGGSIFPNVFCIWTAFQYILFFYMGIQLWMKKDRRILRGDITWKGWILINIIVFIVDNIVQEEKNIFHLGIITGLFLHISGALMAVYVLKEIAKSLRWKENTLFNLLSKYSMSIYLFHQQIIYITLTYFNGKVNPYIHVGINFFVSILGAFIISYFLRYFRITKFLIGEK